MPDNSVDAIVTDPPYGLTQNKKGGSGAASVNLDSPYGRSRIGTGNGSGGFMGMKWDSDVPSVEIWAECLRVLKPGGHLLSFAGTRTHHRIAVKIEDAGFEIRDMIAWVYGSGFPKSHNGEWGGTALKPALEPIVFARKALIGTVEANWREDGTGALNIDSCRVPTTENLNGGAYAKNATEREQMWGAEAGNSYVRGGAGDFVQPEGRWPANLIHDGSEEVLAAFPQSAGQLANVSTTAPSEKTSLVYGRMRREGEPSADNENEGQVGFKMKPGMRRLDTGTAARFFYCAKASKTDRDEGLHEAEDRVLARSCQAQAEAKRGNSVVAEAGAYNKARVRKNNHPTVKPTDLMRYLCRLVTPAGGVVLDPFMGSGSTGKAAVLEGFRFIGIERESDYFDIARARIAAADTDDL